MKPVRLGIIGLGVMGQGHARNVLAGKIPRLCLTAVADSVPARLGMQLHKFIWDPAVKGV